MYDALRFLLGSFAVAFWVGGLERTGRQTGTTGLGRAGPGRNDSSPGR
jgi:hypothetical protein